MGGARLSRLPSPLPLGIGAAGGSGTPGVGQDFLFITMWTGLAKPIALPIHHFVWSVRETSNRVLALN